MDNCVFCNEFMSNKERLFENELAIAFFDGFPVSKGHILIITKRHVKTFFDTTKEEQDAMFELLRKAKEMIDSEYHPTGYNIGIAFSCSNRM